MSETKPVLVEEVDLNSLSVVLEDGSVAPITHLVRDDESGDIVSVVARLPNGQWLAAQVTGKDIPLDWNGCVQETMH